jgi:hypothetical protein
MNIYIYMYIKDKWNKDTEYDIVDTTPRIHPTFLRTSTNK